MIITVNVNNRVASLAEQSQIVCDNGDYQIKFNFSEEWANYTTKTAYFVARNLEIPTVIFDGDTCDVPPLQDITEVLVGVGAGNMYTTTPCYIPVKKSIRSIKGVEKPPKPDVYAQIMEKLNGLEIEKRKPSDLPPLMNGKAFGGKELEYSRADHIHPTDTTRASAETLEEEIKRVAAEVKSSYEVDVTEQNKKLAENARKIAEETARAEAKENELGENIESETQRATTSEADIQSQIDTLHSIQNVVETVGTKAKLDELDTSKYQENDKVQVIADESQGGATTIYGLSSDYVWYFIGAYGGNAYTKTQTNELLNAKADLTYVDEQLGNIETALDNIIAIQSALIGGN